ncbi:hypothetical protein SMC26_12955 [Actinomadura fulvescens]|uniref:Uncharacterized protein n=1 Tax=Actinomadura fulvescens TaxID=46160 RepID=A0ABN3PA18_9ACTN
MTLPYGADHSGPGWREPAENEILWHRSSPFHMAVRAATSILVAGSAIPYLTVAVQGLLRLAAPPARMVMSGDRPRPVDATLADGARVVEPSTLYGPLAVAGALIAGLLLVWAGAAGLRAFREQRAWRRRQGLPLFAYTLGAVAFGLAQLSASSVQVSWHGPNPLIPSALLGLLVAAATIALPAETPAVETQAPETQAAEPDDAAPGPRSGAAV